ncbi:antA/AntB antirepressor family protein [Pectobacterium aroidearum]|uniref:antA/AntB antirepressor family protein n=1 Tax=Pectobacterium aroidearum TaxID=1201031 RepID=UPI00330790DE
MTSKNNDLSGQGFAHPENSQSHIYSWFNGRISQYGFVQGIYFDQLTPEWVEITGTGHPDVDYTIVSDMAKRLGVNHA